MRLEHPINWLQEYLAAECVFENVSLPERERGKAKNKLREYRMKLAHYLGIPYSRYKSSNLKEAL